MLCNKAETPIFHPPLPIESYGKIIQTQISMQKWK